MPTHGSTSTESVFPLASVSPAWVPERTDHVSINGTPQTRVGAWWEQHPRALRALASAALAAGAIWLVYRAVFSWRGANVFAFTALAGVELYNWIGLALLAVVGWRWDRPQRPPASTAWTADVFVCTYDEPLDVVEATLAGCAALRYPHTTYLLDDGDRDEMRELAQRWGATRLTRQDNSHAKAGNINAALPRSKGDLILFLDADHVPLPDALDAVVGYFDDPRVALVQTPHDFYNHDSVQHYGAGRHEQSLFFGVISPGKDRHNAAFWCGSASVIRRSALEEVGGVATETIAEDFHTTIKLHAARWHTRYHNEILVQGLAPVDLDGYLLQRDRWARGNLAVLRLPESPLRRRCGLDLRQRLAYFSGLYAYGAGLVRLVVMTILMLTLAFGVLPARVSPGALVAIWLPSTILALAATTALCRGHMRLGESSHYTLLTAEVFTRALPCAVRRTAARFKVTPKTGVDTGGWQAVSRLRVVLLLSVALLVAVLYRLIAIMGFASAPRLPGVALPFALALAVWELVRVVRTVRVVARRRQRRIHFRFACRLPARVQDRGQAFPAVVHDASVAGFGLTTHEPVEPGRVITATTTVSDTSGNAQIVHVKGCVRSCRQVGDAQWRLGMQLVGMDDESRRRLVTFCHVVHPWRRLRPSVVDETPASPREHRDTSADAVASVC